MNREQRRAYEKRVKHDTMASICPICGKMAKFYTIPKGYFSKECKVICEVCNGVVKDSLKDVAAHIYVKLM